MRFLKVVNSLVEKTLFSSGERHVGLGHNFTSPKAGNLYDLLKAGHSKRNETVKSFFLKNKRNQSAISNFPRLFSTISVDPRASKALEKMEAALSETQPIVAKLPYIQSQLIDPPSNIFAMHLTPDIKEKAREKLQENKDELQLELMQKKLIDRHGKLLFKPGTFYIPYTTAQGIDQIEIASKEQVAQAHCLIGMPLYARQPQEIINVIKSYCNLLGVKDFSQLQKTIPKGVVAYASNNHSRLIEDLRTLNYLDEVNSGGVRPWKFGYPEVFEQFVKPKLAASQGLVKPENFYINVLTASYANRLFDQLMGMLYEYVEGRGGKPDLYLTQCYGFHLIANPYNFNTAWTQANDWRKAILKHVSSDIVWNFNDIATRVAPELDLLLCHFWRSGNNIFQLKNTQRQAVVVVPDLPEDFKSLTKFELGPTILGHSLDLAVKALHEQEPTLVQCLSNYLKKEITKAAFDEVRNSMKHVYAYDPCEGIALGDLISANKSDPLDLAVSTITHHDFLYDLSVLAHGLPLVEEPVLFNFRIINECCLKGGWEIGEVNLVYKTLDWLLIGRVKEVKTVLQNFSLIKNIEFILNKHPEKREKLKLFFQNIYKEHDSNAAELRQQLLIPEEDNVVHERVKKARERLNRFPSRETNELPLTAIREPLVAAGLLRGKRFDPFMLLIEVNRALKVKHSSVLGFGNHYFDSRLKQPQVVDKTFQEGRRVLWECLLESVIEFLNSGKMDQAYCAYLSDQFSYITSLKIRAANQAYTNYLRHISKDTGFKTRFFEFDEKITRAMKDPKNTSLKELQSLASAAKSELQALMRAKKPLAFKQIATETAESYQGSDERSQRGLRTCLTQMAFFQDMSLVSALRTVDAIFEEELDIQFKKSRGQGSGNLRPALQQAALHLKTGQEFSKAVKKMLKK